MNMSMTPVLERLRDQLAALEPVGFTTLYGSYVRGDSEPPFTETTRLLDRAVGCIDAMEAV